MSISFNTRDPVYLQVVHYFKEQMAKRVLEPGQEMPSRRELAQRLKINPNTVQRAFKEMEEQKLIYTEGNLPSCVTKDEAVLKTVREELIGGAVEEFIHAMKSINAPLQEVLSLIEERYESGEQND